jgi:TM2 domain-containing membrane protein YozV
MTEAGRPSVSAAGALPAVPMRRYYEMALVLTVGPLGAHRFDTGRYISGAALLLVTLTRLLFTVHFPDEGPVLVPLVSEHVLKQLVELVQHFTPFLPLTMFSDWFIGIVNPFEPRHHTSELAIRWTLFDIALQLSILALLIFDAARAASGTRMFELLLLLAFGSLGLHRLYAGRYRSGSLWFLAAIAHDVFREWVVSGLKYDFYPITLFLFSKSTVLFVIGGIDVNMSIITTIMKYGSFRLIHIYDILFIPFLFFIARDLWTLTIQVTDQFLASRNRGSSTP